MKYTYMFVITLAFCTSTVGKGSEYSTRAGAQLQAESGATTEETPNNDERLCKYKVRAGSRFEKKLYLTAEEWEVVSATAKAGLGTMQRHRRAYRMARPNQFPMKIVNRPANLQTA